MGLTGMFQLIEDNDLEGVQALVSRSPDELNRIVFDNRTPLAWALMSCAVPPYRKKEAIAKLLIEKGAKLDLVFSTDRMSPLMSACAFNQPETAKLLIQRGASLDLVSKGGWSAAMFAARNDQPETLELLIQKKADLELANQWGWTCLMLCCLKPANRNHTESGMFRCLQMCYGGGANLFKMASTDNVIGSVKVPSGSNALDIARACERYDAVLFLEFIITGEVTKLLIEDLKFSRAIVISFHDSHIRTVDACKQLGDSDLQNIGMSNASQRRKFLSHFRGPSKRLSLLQRISQRISRPSFEYDAFPAYVRGTDKPGRDIHSRVSAIGLQLKEKGIKIYMDDEMSLRQNVERIIRSSRVIVVFVTRSYMLKVNSEGDHCNSEFMLAVLARGVNNMIFVVMEPEMSDQKTWVGHLQIKDGNETCIDYFEDTDVTELAYRINGLIAK